MFQTGFNLTQNTPYLVPLFNHYVYIYAYIIIHIYILCLMNKYSKFSSWCSAQAAARGESWTLPWWPNAVASTLRGTVVELQQLMKAGPWKLGFCSKKRRDFFGGCFTYMALHINIY